MCPLIDVFDEDRSLSQMEAVCLLNPAGARERKIRQSIVDAMLLSDDVLDLKPSVHCMLRKTAVLATVSGTTPHKRTNSLIHYPTLR
jgi:hypothetical protein